MLHSEGAPESSCQQDGVNSFPSCVQHLEILSSLFTSGTFRVAQAYDACVQCCSPFLMTSTVASAIRSQSAVVALVSLKGKGPFEIKQVLVFFFT